MKKVYIVLAIMFVGLATQAQMVKKSEKGTFLLKGATLHTITKGTVQGDLLIRDGIIAEIGRTGSL